MVPFLRQVAAHYYQGPDIEKTCFVFPNRRSLVFFKKYLGDLVRESGSGTPLLLPPLYTIRDFFCHLSRLQPSERLPLVLELYQVYKKHNPAAEPLDDFIFWGDALLGDFDDVDKFLVNARGLMRNVQDLKALQDGMEYLSENQREAITRFLGHFKSGKEGAVKAKFLSLWNLLYPIYTDFNARLREKGMAYEGMAFRSLVQRIQDGTPVADILREGFPETEKYVFVGLNALNECEHLLLRRMRDAGLGEFVWDYVSEEIRNPENKSSLFMKRNVEEFPQAFPLDENLPKPQVTVISVPSAVGQAKLAPQLLAQTEGDPVETAFVLPDETLLLPLLNALPPAYENVNVTMGCPMGGSAIYTLLKALGNLQLKMRCKKGQWYFNHRQVREVITSGLVKKLSTPREAEVIRKIKADAKYYIPPQDLQGGPLLELLFKPVITEPSAVSARANHGMEQYLSDVVAYIGAHLAGKGEMLLELDFAKRCHTALTLLQETDLELLPATHLRVLERLLEGISVPFRGEPLQGLQVMGPLETRALDFRNLIILSANEGMFPRRSTGASFIPPELRRSFGLPTFEYQDAVWAYYFYRMIQRPEKVWILYDSRTEGLKNGEESRFIKQLEYLFPQIPIKRQVAVAPLLPVKSPEDIPKTEAHVDAVRQRELSASALQDYLKCPVRFYYQVVEGLQEEEEVSESLDAGMVGNVFHRVMQQLYGGKETVDTACLEALRKDKTRLRRLIREQILQQLHSIEVSGRNLVLEEIILDYILRTLEWDSSLLKEAGSGGFRIIGLEKRHVMDWKGYRLKGFIDRIDSYKNGEVRVVDYKTGKVQDAEVLITDRNAAAVADKLFNPPKSGEWPKIALQLFVYDLLVHDLLKEERPLVNAVYSTTRLFNTPAPECPENAEFNRLASEALEAMLGQITDTSVPWHHADNPKTCDWCPFKSLCGR